MKEEQILEGNKLIAEFMGWQNHPPRYHQEWNEIMHVVEEIESRNYSTSINGYNVNKFSCSIESWSGDGISYSNNTKTKIEAVYEAVVGFIKWYNHENSLNQ